ncbi:MAG: hypothetical protein NC390_00440 [Fusobacterium sp.]|nr:hypothetical protein [Fusobacterium sp.]MCM1053817.1 hypothetical protein [Ruminococcus sp.]
MDKYRKEYLINNLLLYIKKEMELKGTCIESRYINDYWFKVRFEHLDYFACLLGSAKKPELIPDSDDIRKLKQICDFTEDEFSEILNYCVTNEYLKKYCSDEYTLKRKGMTRANKYEKYLKDNTNNEFILNQEVLNIDEKLTKLIKDARILYLNNDLQTAVEKIWDAFERTKTILNKDKKKGVSAICSICNSSFDKAYIDEEFRTLTKIGNEYQIRHFEIDKKEIKDKKTLSYLFFRAFSFVIFINKNFKKKYHIK